MKTLEILKDIDLVKIVEEVFSENELNRLNELSPGTAKIAALTAMYKLQDICENQANEKESAGNNSNMRHNRKGYGGLPNKTLKLSNKKQNE